MLGDVALRDSRAEALPRVFTHAECLAGRSLLGAPPLREETASALSSVQEAAEPRKAVQVPIVQAVTVRSPSHIIIVVHPETESVKEQLVDVRFGAAMEPSIFVNLSERIRDASVKTLRRRSASPGRLGLGLCGFATDLLVRLPVLLLALSGAVRRVGAFGTSFDANLRVGFLANRTGDHHEALGG